MMDRNVDVQGIEFYTDNLLQIAKIIRENEKGNSSKLYALSAKHSAEVLYDFWKNGDVTNPTTNLICGVIAWKARQSGMDVNRFLAQPHAGEVIACALKGTAALPVPKPAGRVIANDQPTA